MTDPQSPPQIPSIRASEISQETHGHSGFRPAGVPSPGVPQGTQESQWKGTAQGQVPLFPAQSVGDRNVPGVNGFTSQGVPQPPANVRPSLHGQSFMNGPSSAPPPDLSQSSNPYQPNMISNKGQFVPSQRPPPAPLNRPPGYGSQGHFAMHGQLPPNQMGGQLGPSARMPTGPLSQVGENSSDGPSSQRSSNTNSPATVNPNLDALEGQFRNTPDQDTESSTEGDTIDKQPYSDKGNKMGTSMIQQPKSIPSFQAPGPQISQPRFSTPTNQAGIDSAQPTQPHFPMPAVDGFQQHVTSQDSGFPSTTTAVNSHRPTGPTHPASYPSQRPGFHPAVSSNQQPAFQPFSSSSERPRFQVPPVSTSQHQGFTPVSAGVQGPGFQPVPGPAGQGTGTQQFASTSSQQPRFQGPVLTTQQPALDPSLAASQRPPLATGQPLGFTPVSAPNQRPGLPPPPSSQQPGLPPFSSSALKQPGFPPVPSAANQQQGIPPVSTTSQRPGFPQPPSSTTQQPGFPPMSAPSQRPGFPPPPLSGIRQPGFEPVSSAGQRPGFPPPPISVGQQPGFPPPPISVGQQTGFPPMSIPSQRPGFPPPPVSANQIPGFPPPPVSANQQPGFPPTGIPTERPGFLPSQVGVPGGQQTNFTSNQLNQAPGQGQFSQMQQGKPQGKSIQEFVNSYPAANSLNASMGSMSLQPGSQTVNLLQAKNLIPREGVEVPNPTIPNDNKKINCSPEVFRCTLNAIPQTSGLLNKARLPLGILIHPFKDLSSLPVIQSSVIVRCRSCRTYINPFVYFVDSRRWKCNLCYRVNELPDEFSFDPVSKTYGDPQRRPEIRSATIEFIAPSEYMLRPPQPAVYLYLLNVSFNAVETGYLNVFCDTLLDVLDKIPGDSRTQIGFIAYDSAVHFFNLDEGLSQPQMLTVSDVDDIFLPCPDTLLVNLSESRERVIDLLNLLPTLFEGNMETGTALGAALQAGFKMTSSVGGRITVMQTNLPTVGPGALHNREDASQQTSKDVANLGPGTDFYKKLALDCSAQQIAVDLFMFNSQFADLASIECISKFSGGCVYYYPMFHSVATPHLAEKFEMDLRRYLTRKIGFESVMRIRCSKGLSIHTFHGNFFVRSTDLLSLPNINPDAGFGMQMSIEESLTDMTTMCFQAALLYTSSKGERRIRVHTLCLPVTNQLSEVYAAADQQAIVALLAKMAVDRCISSSMSDAREAIANAVIDVLNAYGSTLTSTQRVGSLCINDTLRLMPLYCLALLKSMAFRVGVATRLDERVYAMEQCKSLPVSQLIQMIHPDLYPVHTIMEVEMVKKGSQEVPDLPILQLSSANIDRFGAYLLDTGETIYLYIGSAINPQFCKDILDKPNFTSVKEGGMTELPELENQGSERLRSFLTYLLDSRPNGASFIIVREDGKYRMQFFHHFVEDRTESSMSYYEFLQHIQKQVKS